MDAVTRVPAPTNEPILAYAPGTPERAEVQTALKDLAATRIDLPMTIGGRQVMGRGTKVDVVAAARPSACAGHPQAGDPGRRARCARRRQGRRRALAGAS